MWCDVSELHNFYSSPQGLAVSAVLRPYLHNYWPNLNGLTFVAYGYGLPYMDTFSQEASKSVLFMPAPMGITYCTHRDKNQSILCHTDTIPMQDSCVDRLLLIHSLEFSEDTTLLLENCWRVLKDWGEMIVVTPNRRGIWCRMSDTPLGYGHPYTGKQLFKVLSSNNFTPEKPIYGLFHPPMKIPFPYRAFNQIEKYGSKWFKKLGGVVMIKAKKQVFAGIKGSYISWRPPIFIPNNA